MLRCLLAFLALFLLAFGSVQAPAELYPSGMAQLRQSLRVPGPPERPANFITTLADSRGAATYLNAAGTNRGALSPLNWANDLGGAGYLIGPTFGVSGNRTDQFFTRLSAAIATGAGTLHLWGGVNNFAQTSNANTYTHAVTGAVIGSAQVAQSAANDIILMSNTALAAGMRVVIEAEAGGNNLDATQVANVRTFNALITNYATTTPRVYLHNARSIILVDPAAAIPVYKTGLSEDGVHENARGAYYHGKSLRALLNSFATVPYFLAPARDAIPLPAAGRVQLANNPIFATASGGTLGTNVTGTVPGSCTTAIVAGATMSVAVAADASGIGNDVVLSPTFAAANDAVRLYSDITAANWSPGDIVEGVAEIVVTGAANLKSVQLELTISGLDASGVQVGLSSQDMNTGVSNSGPDESYSITLRTRLVTVPTNMTTKQFMQIALRGIGAQAATAGATTITVKKMVVNRVSSAPYSFGYDLPKLPEAANDNAALEMAA